MRGSRRPREQQKRGKLKFAAALAAGMILTTVSGVCAIGWWLDYSDEPAPADILVVLAGGIARTLYGADLFAQGLASEIWLARPVEPAGVALARESGVKIAAEEEINRDILIARGVPSEKIRLYGRSVMSTINEALALARSTEVRGKKILIVTSRFHARRASWIFRYALPESDILVVATPYEDFTRRWWTSQALAQAAILEIAKTLYFLGGGRFVSNFGTPERLRSRR